MGETAYTRQMARREPRPPGLALPASLPASRSARQFDKLLTGPAPLFHNEWGRTGCRTFYRGYETMKNAFAGFAVMMLAAVVGCGPNNPGGPGVKPNEKPPVVGTANDTFTLSMPVLSTSVKQGSQADVTVGISRGKNFDQDVALAFAPLPTGVTIEPAAPTIKHGDENAKLKVIAAPDAALGDFTIKVTGHPTKGVDATNDLKVSVVKE